MKLFHFLFALVIGGTASATDYYIDPNGSDANNGLTPATAFQTIAKVNSVTWAATGGNTIYFKRGGVYYGGLVIQANNTTVTAYGTGAKPIISGFSVVPNASWTLVSGNIWKAIIPAAPNKRLNVFVYGTTLAEVARYPNPNTTDGGFLKYESSANENSIVDNQIPVPISAASFVGADVFVRKNIYASERRKISGISGGTITFTSIPSNNDAPGVASAIATGDIINPFTNGAFTGTAGYGYFIENSPDPLVLDRDREWAFDAATKTLYAYFTYSPVTSSNVGKVSTVEKLIDISTYNNTTITDIDFEGGNQFAIYGGKTLTGTVKPSGVTVTGCRITTIGGRGIGLYAVDNVTVQYCWIQYCYATAIQLAWVTTSTDYRNANCTVLQNDIYNIAPFPGMAGFNDAGDGNAVHINGSNYINVESNVFNGAAKAAINWQGNYATIQKNKIQNAVKEISDMGAIYTFVDKTGPISYPSGYISRSITSNTIYDCFGQGFGTPNATEKGAKGIYLDGRTPNVTVSNNTIYNVLPAGISCNNPFGVSLTGNTVYNSDRAITFSHLFYNGWNVVTDIDINIQNNILYSTSANSLALLYINENLTNNLANVNTALSANLAGVGTINNNYYGHVNPVPFKVDAYDGLTPTTFIQIAPMKLASWQSASGSTQDANSHVIDPVSLYTITSEGPNLVTSYNGGLFTSGIGSPTAGGITASTPSDPSDVYITPSAENGMLKCIMNNTNSNSAADYASVSGRLSYPTGTSLLNGSKYIFRVQTTGTSDNGILKAYLRTFGQGTPEQMSTFGTASQTHEFLFKPTANLNPALFTVLLQRNSAANTPDNYIYLDNVEVHLVTADETPITDIVKFCSNPWSAAFPPNPAIPDGTYKDVYGNTYTSVNNSLSIPAMSSRLLFRQPGSARVAPVRPQTAEVTLPAAINCYPNPAGDVLYISNLNVKDNWQSLSITNFAGSRVLPSLNIKGQTKVTVNVAPLAAGEYIALIKDKNGKTTTLKFVKL